MITAIETRYAGYKFRSRLEARWAVFFDHMHIRYQYEPQGLVCSARLSQRNEKIPYLPDFWFPDFKAYGEVKGDLSEPDLLRLLDVAASLSSNDGGGCHDSGGNDLVVFGNIPSPNHGEEGYLPTRLHLHKGTLEASGWTATAQNSCHGWAHADIAGDYGGDLATICQFGVSAPEIREWLVRGSWASPCISFPDYLKFTGGYQAARSARFEHGQSGA